MKFNREGKKIYDFKEGLKRDPLAGKRLKKGERQKFLEGRPPSRKEVAIKTYIMLKGEIKNFLQETEEISNLFGVHISYAKDLVEKCVNKNLVGWDDTDRFNTTFNIGSSTYVYKVGKSLGTGSSGHVTLYTGYGGQLMLQQAFQQAANNGQQVVIAKTRQVGYSHFQQELMKYVWTK